MTVAALKAPFPYFGGKSKIASLVWSRLGCVDNYIEPFCGSAAVLLLRPDPPKIETVNDADCYLANFWRSTATCPEEVAAWADSPVNEADLHSRHRWLVLSPYAAEFRRRMRTEPGYFDARIAGWWCWGLCCWIGSGWCQADQLERHQNQPPHHSGMVMCSRGQDSRKPRIDGGEGQYGHGIHAKALSQQLPRLAGDHHFGGLFIHADTIPDTNRPQLADAFSRGRGVNGNDSVGTCAERLAWITDWFQRPRDRLRTVRVCCGDWKRVCSSESVTTRLGVTGIFFDPPYGDDAGRNMNLYSVDSGTVAADVRAYCLERGADPKMRIALCGYAGEGHEVLEAKGWTCEAWQAHGGYGNRSEKGKENAAKERIWFSKGCLSERTLFDDLAG